MDKPFIKLFHTPNSGYFLDVNMNQIIQISKTSYQYLYDLLSDRNDGCALMPNELIALKREGFLDTESVVKEVRHPYSDFIDVFLERKVSKITLQVTQECNLRCKYCIYDEDRNRRQRSHSNRSMSWSTAKKAMDFLWERSVDSTRVNVGFYGGEPLIEFSLIKKTIQYSEYMFSGKELTFSLTTNGTLLNDEIILYLQNHNVSLMISLDGPKDINDINRVFSDGSGTYDAIIEKIERIKIIAPEYAAKLQISMVIDQQNDFDCINTVFLDESEINGLTLLSSNIDRDYDDIGNETPNKFTWKSEYHMFLAFLSHYGRYPKDRVSPLLKRTLSEAVSDYSRFENSLGLYDTDAPSGPCVPGQFRPFITVSGRIFPCERVSEMSNAMCIGSLDNGFFMENVTRILNIGHITEQECKNCWCFRYCNMCAKKADYNGNDLSAERKLAHCATTKANAYNKIRQRILLKEIPIYYQKQASTRKIGSFVL